MLDVQGVEHVHDVIPVAAGRKDEVVKASGAPDLDCRPEIVLDPAERRRGCHENDVLGGNDHDRTGNRALWVPQDVTLITHLVAPCVRGIRDPAIELADIGQLLTPCAGRRIAIGLELVLDIE